MSQLKTDTCTCGCTEFTTKLRDDNPVIDFICKQCGEAKSSIDTSGQTTEDTDGVDKPDSDDQ